MGGAKQKSKNKGNTGETLELFTVDQSPSKSNLSTSYLLLHSVIVHFCLQTLLKVPQNQQNTEDPHPLHLWQHELVLMLWLIGEQT